MVESNHDDDKLISYCTVSAYKLKYSVIRQFKSD